MKSGHQGSYSLFMCQDEDENEDNNQSFGSFLNLCMTNKPILQCIIVLRAWFVRHSLYPQRTKKFVFGFVFVFVLANEQPISKASDDVGGSHLWLFRAW